MKRVLLVEDDEVVRGVIEGHLVQAGYQVTSADTGEAAAAALGAEPGAFCAVVCDVALPGMSGPEALAAAGAAALGGAGVLFLSGLANAPTIDIPGRPVAQLAKPFQPAELLDHVSKVAR